MCSLPLLPHFKFSIFYLLSAWLFLFRATPLPPTNTHKVSVITCNILGTIQWEQLLHEFHFGQDYAVDRALFHLPIQRVGLGSAFTTNLSVLIVFKDCKPDIQGAQRFNPLYTCWIALLPNVFFEFYWIPFRFIMIVFLCACQNICIKLASFLRYASIFLCKSLLLFVFCPLEDLTWHFPPLVSSQ